MTLATHTYPQHQIQNGTTQIQRGLMLFLIWIFIGPLATNMMTMFDPRVQVFEVETDVVGLKRLAFRDGFFDGTSSATVTQLLDPTRMLVAVFVLIFLLNTVVRHKLGSFDRTELWMAAFSLILLISVIFRSKVIGYSVRIASDAFIVPFLTYFIARRLITDENRFQKLIRCIAYMGIYVIVLSLIQRFTTQNLFFRLTGPFPNHSALYVVMAVVFFVVLSEHVYSMSVHVERRALAGPARRFVLFFAPVVVLLGWSRGDWLGFVLAICIFLFLGHRLMTRSRKFALIGLTLLLGAMMSFGITLVAETLGSRVGNLSTVYGRIATWQVAIESGLTSPAFGIGLNNLREVLATNIVKFEGVPNFPRIHNSYLAILAEQGVIGLLAYLSIMAALIRLGIRVRRSSSEPLDQWRGITVIAVVSAYLVPAMFANILHVPVPFAHLLVYAFCGAVAGRYGRISRTVPVRFSRRVPLIHRLENG
jgi:O-antigen ligase